MIVERGHMGGTFVTKGRTLTKKIVDSAKGGLQSSPVE